MASKTERFEMRLDPSILSRIDNWRNQQNDDPSRAEAIRRLVENGLAASSNDLMHFSKSEKLTTWLLTEVLKQQKGYPDKDTINLIQGAICGGHLWALKWGLTDVLYDHVDSPNSVTIVVNIMNMWSFIEDAYAGLSEAEISRIEKELGPHVRARFISFDGNKESESLGIAEFLVEKMGRFSIFKGRNMNSHFPIIDQYQRMLQAFDSMREKLIGRKLDADELIELLRLKEIAS